MNIDNDIKIIRYNLLKDRFVNELGCLTEDMIIIVDDNHRMKQLKHIIEKCDNILNKPSETNTLKDYLTNISNMSYMKNWRRLSIYQKQAKLKEYTETFDNKLNSLKLLLKSLRHNKLKEKNVKYNIKTAKIDTITNLKFNKKINKYELGKN